MSHSCKRSDYFCVRKPLPALVTRFVHDGARWRVLALAFSSKRHSGCKPPEKGDNVTSPADLHIKHLLKTQLLPFPTREPKTFVQLLKKKNSSEAPRVQVFYCFHEWHKVKFFPSHSCPAQLGCTLRMPVDAKHTHTHTPCVLQTHSFTNWHWLILSFPETRRSNVNSHK